MQLKIQRSQRAGALSSKVIFCIDARAYFSAAEQANIAKYRLGNEVIYNSEASRKHLDAAALDHAQGNYAKSLARFALVAINLNIRINDLQRGQHIECKDMNELLAAEEAIYDACEKLKFFLETAATFDGREVVVDFSQNEPAAITKPLPLPAASPQPIVSQSPSLADTITPSAADTPGPAAAEATAPVNDPFRQFDNPEFATGPNFDLLAAWWRTRPRIQRVIMAGAACIIFFWLFFQSLGHGGFGFTLGVCAALAYIGIEAVRHDLR